jgi:hypothetical protein
MLSIPYGFASPVMAAGTESIHIVKYDSDGTTILDEMTVAYTDMEAALPVQGDGVTHQYLQGPVFTGDPWDPGETVNIKDWGSNKGTDLMDLCELVGGMSPGDTVEVKAADGLSRTYDYPNVYTPDPRQGKMVICWWYDGQYVPSWGDGMRLVFFAETTNPDGLHVFGNWDQHECLAQNRWYFYNGEYPTTTGHSVKYVNRINIYSNQTIDNNPDISNLTISVSGSGTTTPSAGVYSYTRGTVVNITATPASGWRFTSWTGAVSNPTSSTTTVTMDGDKTVTASFTQITINQNYILTMAVSGSGTTTPSVGVHPYPRGTVVNVTATPASGWRFASWTGAVSNPTSSTTTVTMDGDKTVTASFTQITINQNYILTMAVSGSGTINPSVGVHSYAQGTVVNISATPASGWRFASWTGAVSNPTSSTTTVTMDGDKTVMASFTQITINQNYILTMAVSGSGTTTPSTGVHPYPRGTVVDITATPASGCQFIGWTGDVEDPNSASTATTMNEDKTVTARFTQNNLNQENILTMAVSGNGTTTPSRGVHFYAPGITLHITATPASGWQFVNWTGSVADSGSANTTLFVDSDKTITANFTRIYLLTMAVSGNGTTTPLAGIHTYTQNTTVNITATPASGWQFVNWTGAVADPASSTTNVTMDGDKTITASFTRIIQSYNLTMSVSGNGTTMPPAGIHTYTQDTMVNITATPASGWRFVNWTGALSDPASANTTVTMYGDKTITASFTRITQNYDLTLAVSGSGTTTPAASIHSYAQGTVVNINAAPASGWQFTNWTGDVTNPASANTTVTVESDKTITAIFTQYLQNETLSSGNPDNIPQIEEAPQGIPWYITLAIVGGIVVIVISLVVVIRRNR